MTLRNTTQRFGMVTILIHWLVALSVIGLFILGLWMTSLTLYHPWYHRAPELHKSVGLLLFGLMGLRLIWRLSNTHPAPLESHTPLERKAAGHVHWLLYGLLFATMFFGYLISTAEGKAVYLFGWFGVPPTITSLPEQADLAGDIHLGLAVVLIGIALLHGAAAIKHHFVDRDRTLLRMLGR